MASITRQVVIPQTDKKHYITGIYALNVIPPEDTSGDWHGSVFYWRDPVERPARLSIAGRGTFTSTTPIFGDMGVYEGRERLIGKGLVIQPDIKEVWIANHSRAILDMLYESLTTYNAVYNLNGATEDWLDTLEQKEFVLSQAKRLTPVLTDRQRDALNKWIEYEESHTTFSS